MDNSILEIANTWAENTYFDEVDREDLKKLINEGEKNAIELRERFHQDLEFGTGGLRSIIGFGRNRMNKYNVRKATQAMANYVLKTNKKNPSACISFDCRNFSKEFSKEVASVFAGNGIKAYLYKELTPTPLLSYAVRYHHSSCGVMVTASHNPKEYNGYKAYWSEGEQVTPPHDQNIITEYNNISNWNEIKRIDFDKAKEEGLIEYISDDVTESFYKLIEAESLNRELLKEKGRDLKIVFTSLHGTSLKPCTEILKRLHFESVDVIKEQMAYDGNFPTVKTTPNPEDPVALEFAVKKLIETNADIAFGADPDCDRLGVVVHHKNDVHYLNGNQIAFLMLHYVLSERARQEKLPKNPLVIKSIVTSELQKNIAHKYGATVIDTLTGFKWMAMKMKELEDQNSPLNFVFASEESFGYLPYKMVRDKDAISAIALMSEVACFYKNKNMTLIDALDEIYNLYGFAQESLIALTFKGLDGKEKINKIMNFFRENYKNIFKTETVKVFQDYKDSSEINLETNEKKILDIVESNVLGLEFKSGNKLFLRPSGTEPKIKFYTMVTLTHGELEGRKKKATDLIKDIESQIHKIVDSL